MGFCLKFSLDKQYPKSTRIIVFSLEFQKQLFRLKICYVELPEFEKNENIQQKFLNSKKWEKL